MIDKFWNKWTKIKFIFFWKLFQPTNLTKVVQNWIKYFLDDPKWFRITGTIVFKWLMIDVTYNDWSPTVSIVCQDNFVIAVNAGSQAFSRSWISIWIDCAIILYE